MAIGDVFDGNVDTSSSTVSELILSLKSAFQSAHFSEVESILSYRELKLKREIEEKAEENKQLEKWNGLLELEILDKERVENELKSCLRECIELRQLNSRLTQELNDLNERLQADAVNQQTIIELKRKNCELECAKLKAETEAEIYKRRFDELEPRVSFLEKDTIELEENENAHMKADGSLSCLIPEDADGSSSCPLLEDGDRDLKIIGSGRPVLGDIVEIVDSDDDSSPCEFLGTKEMAITAHGDQAQSGQAVAERETEVLKRKRASSVIEEGNCNNQDVDDNCSTEKPKMTKIQKIIHKHNSSPAMNCSAATLSFGTNNRAREFTPSKLALLLACEEKMGADNKYQNGSDSSSSSSSEDEWDFSVDFSTINKNWQRRQVNGAHKSWEIDADMITAFEKDGELCMEAICALYRQQTSARKSIYGTSTSQNRGFNKLVVTRGTTLAEFLIDGDPQGKLKKSKLELVAYDPKGLDDCRRIAIDHSKQLFEIYQKQEDPLFLN
ncbi:hypothetical protein GH714_005438 [Hevea brasiliensis]|uniref:Uncharacterized protein n=1 Tax=Hevea brasiliensis TaxID=3981 RepID=A0A6A6L8Z6_HEVBR|nr:hypothetical protein GH714_005438 [Hevea brasiliensis]